MIKLRIFFMIKSRKSYGIACVPLGVLLLLSFGLRTTFAKPFDCAHSRCGVTIDAPYPNLVVGKVDGIATPAQAQAIFQNMWSSGLWHVFPASASGFAMDVQPISIEIAPGKSITVLASIEEEKYEGLQIGSFARFAPHRGLHVKPRPNDPYWKGIGCVILLCRPTDNGCVLQYRTGIYRVSDGRELDGSGRHLLDEGLQIDTMSMRVKS